MNLESELRTALNRCSAENASNTPDFVLARYLLNCLEAFNMATQQRTAWHDEPYVRLANATRYKASVLGAAYSMGQRLPPHEDTERLDWLEREVLRHYTDLVLAYDTEDGFWLAPVDPGTTYGTALDESPVSLTSLRAAIDAARRANPEPL